MGGKYKTLFFQKTYIFIPIKPSSVVSGAGAEAPAKADLLPEHQL